MDRKTEDIKQAELEEQKFLKNVLGFAHRASLSSSLIGAAAASVSFANGHMISGGLYCLAVVVLVSATVFLRKRYVIAREKIVE